jgi:hypothetical protein
LNLSVPPGPPLVLLLHLKTQLNVVVYMDIIILMSWCIWMARNDFIFRGKDPSIPDVKTRFQSEFALVVLRAKFSWKTHMSLWLASAL